MTANEMIGEWPVWGRRFRNSNVAWQSCGASRLASKPTVKIERRVPRKF
jgi:hypothetical protein